MSENEQIEALVKKHAQEISEHVESVRIFVTFHGNGTTKGYSYGCGNFYAQRGQISEWCIRQDEIERLEASSTNE